MRNRFIALALALTLAAAGLGAALAATAPAGAATGADQFSAGQAGYAATGAWYRYAEATTYLRDASQFGAYLQGVGGSISLWDTRTGKAILLGISTGTAAPDEPYSPGVNIYDGHTLIASTGTGVHDHFCDAAGDPCQPGSGFMAPGQHVTLSIYYDRGAGILDWLEYDQAGDIYKGWYRIGTGFRFNRAEVSSDFGSFPWQSDALTGTYPPAPTSDQRWYHVHLTSYNGTRGTLDTGRFTAHRLIATLAGSVVYAEPGPLSPAGGTFRTYLEPVASAPPS